MAEILSDLSGIYFWLGFSCGALTVTALLAVLALWASGKWEAFKV